MSDTISLKLPIESPTWNETLELKNKTPRMYPYETVASSPDDHRLMFFYFKNQLVVIDTICGSSTTLKDNLETYGFSAIFFFCPTSSTTGVMFQQSQVGAAGANRFQILATHCKMDYVKKELVQLDKWSLVICLHALYEIIPLKNGSTVLFSGRYIDEQTGDGVNYVEYIRTFDLTQMKFVDSPIFYQNPRGGPFSMSVHPTFYKDFYYIFMLPFFCKYSSVKKNMESILKITPKDNKAELLKLKNDLSFWPIVRSEEEKHLMDGCWKDNKFYIHFAVNLNNSSKNQCFYRHFFAVLNLHELKWTQIEFNKKFFTIIPMKMTVSNDDVFILVKSLDARRAEKEERSIEDVKGLDSHLLNSENHSCCAHRIPLRVPTSLFQNSLSALNKFYPLWKKNQNAFWVTIL